MRALPEKDKAALRERFKDAVINVESFERTYNWCTLEGCGGTCCTHGVWLEPEEGEFLKSQEAYLRENLPKIGMDVTGIKLIDESEQSGRFVSSTATKKSHNPRAPEGWQHSACSFRREDGACGLQLLAVHEGKHPWHYKPTYCWLFPIDIDEELSPPQIEVIHAKDDPEFTAKTQCGTPQANGKPGYEIFAREIAALSELLGRDLMQEIKEKINAKQQLLSA